MWRGRLFVQKAAFIAHVFRPHTIDHVVELHKYVPVKCLDFSQLNRLRTQLSIPYGDLCS